MYKKLIFNLIVILSINIHLNLINLLITVKIEIRFRVDQNAISFLIKPSCDIIESDCTKGEFDRTMILFVIFNSLI